MHRQGDILFEKVDSIPQGAKKIKATNGRFVIADGEATGHSHSIAVSSSVTMLEHGDDKYLDLRELNALVEHQEHSPIDLEAGIWKASRQREWTDAEEPIYVRD